MSKKRKGVKGKSENKLVFKIITPKNMVTVGDLKDIDDILMVDVIDYKNGNRVGTFKLGIARLKFSF